MNHNLSERVPQGWWLEDLLLKAGALGVLTVFAMSLIQEPMMLVVSTMFFFAVLSALVYPIAGVFCIVALTPFESVVSMDFNTVKVLKLIMAGIVCVRLYLDGRRQSQRERDPYRKVIYWVVAGAVMCTLRASSPMHSALGIPQVLLFWGLYLAVCRIQIGENDYTAILRWLIAVSWPVAVIAILQATGGYTGLMGSREQQLIAAQGSFATFWPSIQRASATFGSNNAAGAFFASSALAALLHVLLLPRARFLYLLIAFTLLVALSLTFSRGALLGLLAGLLFQVCTIGGPRIRWTVSLSVLCLSLSLFFFVPVSQVLGYLRVNDDVLSASISRVRAWQGAWEMIRQHPVSGIGFYEFKEGMAALEGDPDAPAHPHNGILKATVEGGIIGGIVYLWYFTVFVRSAVTSIKRFSNRPRELWVFSSVAIIGICLFSQELFDAGLTMGGSSMAILFSLLLGLQTNLRNALEAQSPQLDGPSLLLTI